MVDLLKDDKLVTLEPHEDVKHLAQAIAGGNYSDEVDESERRRNFDEEQRS